MELIQSKVFVERFDIILMVSKVWEIVPRWV